MGTRGFMGFVVNGEAKITYNHFDSYPEGLGVDMLGWLRAHVIEDAEQATVLHPEVASMIARLRMVDEDTPPTDEQWASLAGFRDPAVNRGEGWYSLLRETQGNPAAMLRAGYMIDGSAFPFDSLFCEWGYLIDADARAFEAYRGFRHAPPTEGRWVNSPSANPHDGYCAVQRVGLFPFAALPDDDTFISRLTREDEDD